MEQQGTKDVFPPQGNQRWQGSSPKLYSFCRLKYCNMSKKTACVILAPGAEEMEFTISVDVLRRADIAVTVAGLLGPEDVKCSRDLIIKPDGALKDVTGNNFDVIVLPGGLGGSRAMAESSVIGDFLKKQDSEGRFVAAICAAPIALAAHGIGLGKCLTSYPSVKDQLEPKYKYVDDQNVVVDGHLITSRGPGTAFQFALKVVETLVGSEKATSVAKAMLIN